MRTLKDIIRNYKKDYKDWVIKTAVAIYNFRKTLKSYKYNYFK